MPLSINKLEKLLASRNLVCNTYFTLQGECVYIEVLSYDSSEVFLLYIPSKYKFGIPRDGSRSVYELKFLDIDGDMDNVIDDNIESPDHKQIENNYKEINLDMSPDTDHRKLTQQLEEQYRRPITLKDISKRDGNELKELYRQLKRIRFCVQNIKYKAVILVHNYICAISRDDSIMCFLIKNYPKSPHKRMIVTTDLELLYEKMDSVLANVVTVREGIYNVLNRNQTMHSERLDKLLNQRNEIQSNMYRIQNKLEDYSVYLRQLEKMLKNITNAEQRYIEEMHNLKEKYKYSTDPQEGADRSQLFLKYTTNVKKIAGTKQNIVRLLLEVRGIREDLILSLDKIMFDNQIMVHQIFKNHGELVKLSKKTM